MAGALRRDLQDVPWLRAARRIFDRRPMHCGLYVTDRCNLACAYCAEFDNSEPHPGLEVLRQRIDRVAGLGVVKIALAGGEPLLHPDIDTLIAHTKAKGLNVSLSTNGLLLDEAMLRRLEEAGLDALQLSVDRMTPSPTTRKALVPLMPLLPALARSRVKVHLAAVVCADTLDEIEEVLLTGLDAGIPTELRLVHGDDQGVERAAPGKQERLLEIWDLQIRLKQEGRPVHATSMVLEHGRRRLLGEHPKWKCLAGYKIFFVSAQGAFWPCSIVRTDLPIEEVDQSTLDGWDREKECQDVCGVTCGISNSLFLARPIPYLAAEVGPKIRRYLGAGRCGGGPT